MAKQTSRKSKSKPPKPIIEINDYYSILNRCLFALNSRLSLFQLAYELQLIFNNTFQRIENYPFIFDETRPQDTAVFTRRIFTQISNGNFGSDNRARLILFDNKIDLDLNLKSNREKNLNIQTLSLFPPDYYLFSRQGIKKFSAEFNDCNSLLLVIFNKSFPFHEIEEPLRHAAASKSIFKLYDAHDLLYQKTKAEAFLGAFSIDSEKKIIDFAQQTQAQCLRETKYWEKLKLSDLDLPLCTIRNEESLRLLQYDESYEPPFPAHSL